MKKFLSIILVLSMNGFLAPAALAAEKTDLLAVNAESAGTSNNPSGLTGASAGGATSRAGSLEFFLNLGSARQTGYLTTQEALGSYLFGFHIWANTGSFAFEFGGFSADHDTGEFYLVNNQKVSVSTFSWMSYLGVYSTDSLKLALGIGPAVVTVSQVSPESRIPYGTFIFAGMARYELNEHWNLQFKTQWYEIEQAYAGQTTEFQVWTNTLGFAYNWTVQ